jgi:hypothetical protein
MTDVFRMAWRTFHMSKAGHRVDEYEDAFAGDPEQGRFAIADGASESAFADAWARILVKAYVETPGPWSGWLDAARERWRVQVEGRELPWYAETKFAEGAYAAMLGLAFTKDRWIATAVGDCCFFQVRDHGLRRAFPMRHSREFGNRPSLLSSRSRLVEQPRTRRFHLQGNFRAGDAVLLMTDALSQWFLQQAEGGRQPWKDLQALATDEQFVESMKDLRETGKLRNDDVTLMLIQPWNS